MATYQKLQCEKCKYYESFHQYPNPNAYARHYCKKCNDEIKYVRVGFFSDFYTVWLPKGCYFNDYFEESDMSKRERERQENFNPFDFCQVED